MQRSIECNKCKGVLAVSGRAWNDVDVDDEGNPFIEHFLEIKYVNPTPNLFPIPNNCPKEVALLLKQSFHLFWIDLDSAANKVRQAVEALMDFCGIDKEELTKDGEHKRLSLHKRIKLFQAQKKDLAESLFAIKWIGNSGSHESGIKSDDIFDTYDIVEQVIEDMFAKSRERIASLVREINTIEGPCSKQLKSSTKKPSENK